VPWETNHKSDRRPGSKPHMLEREAERAAFRLESARLSFASLTGGQGPIGGWPRRPRPGRDRTSAPRTQEAMTSGKARHL